MTAARGGLAGWDVERRTVATLGNRFTVDKELLLADPGAEDELWPRAQAFRDFEEHRRRPGVG